jgi:flagellar hook-associated protein 3 FlgL
MNRVSTASIFNQALFTLLNQQAQIARTQLELSSGRKIITAQDDPIGAAQSLAIDRSLAEIERWGANSNIVTNRLQREEEVLRQLGDRMQRMRELAVQANSAIQTPDTLRGMVFELRQIREGLVQLGNTTDGTGRFLFGGTQDGSPPFIENAGGVQYVGDQNQRRIEIGPELTVADTDPGSEIFQRIRTGNGVFVTRQNVANSGSLTLSSTGFTDTAAWDNRNYTIAFSEPDPIGAPGQYAFTITDGGGNAVLPPVLGDPPIPYVAGQAIEFSGVQITLTGTPADGDSFSVGPSPNQDLFRSIDQLIAAVQAPIANANEQATRQNQFYNAIESLSQAADWVIDKRASLGARLATLDRTADQRLAENEILRNTLSSIRDTDFAEAISRLSFQLQTLEASQLSFAKVQNLSLFNFLR